MGHVRSPSPSPSPGERRSGHVGHTEGSPEVLTDVNAVRFSKLFSKQILSVLVFERFYGVAVGTSALEAESRKFDSQRNHIPVVASICC